MIPGAGAPSPGEVTPDGADRVNESMTSPVGVRAVRVSEVPSISTLQ